MLNYKVEGLGEVSLYVNKGAVGEFEDYFGKPWIQIVTGMTFEHWRVLIHKCYIVACYRSRTQPEYTLNDFKAFIDDDVFKQMITDVDAKLNEVLEIPRLLQELEKVSKKKK